VKAWWWPNRVEKCSPSIVHNKTSCVGRELSIFITQMQDFVFSRLRCLAVWSALHTVKQSAQHRLLRELCDRVWCDLTVCATVWRFSNRFQFCCAKVMLCNSLKCVWACLRPAVPRHLFIIDSHTVLSSFSKCHIQLHIKNSGGNLYSFIFRCWNYGKWKVKVKVQCTLVQHLGYVQAARPIGGVEV